MSIFDRFGSKPEAREGYVGNKVEFTAEESEAITASMVRLAAFANTAAPEHATMYSHPKAQDAITAKALVQYVERLISRLGHCHESETAVIINKALKSQLKAYAIHNLPVYLYQAASIFESTGDFENANKFFRLFLQMQDDFTPDEIDRALLEQTGLDIPKIIATTRQKVR